MLLTSSTYKQCIVMSLMMASAPSLWAGILKGKIVDQNKMPVEFVNVAVYKPGETAPLKGTIADQQGGFLIEGLKEGSYTVKISYMGYKSLERNVTIAHDQTLNLHTLTLMEDSEVLQEVNVTAQKAAMKLEIDKKVFDVAQSITTVGLSASEALENIPSVEVDAEGNVSLRGSQSVTIWINGKAQGMTSDNRGDILQQMPAESIERIEVITNPSSKYSPEGSAGIINIILKRDRKAGYFGGVQLSANKQKGEDWGGRAGANINYSSGILEAYANIGLNQRRNGGGGWTRRDYVDPASEHHYGFLNSDQENHNRGGNLFGRAGLTWHITQKDEITAGFMGMTSLKGNEGSSLYRYTSDYYSSGMDYGRILPYPYYRTRESKNENDMLMKNFELGYRHEWATGHNFEATLSYGTWAADGESWYDQNTYHLEEYNAMGDKASALNSYQSQVNEHRNSHWNVQADYVRPLTDKSKLEAGYKGSFSHENSPITTYNSPVKSESTIIQGLYNRFIYDSNVHAFYANYQSKVGEKFGYQLGLRGEYWTTEAVSKSYEDEFVNNVSPKEKKDFFELFPTAFLSYQLPKNQELQLNYTRRLQRPWGGQLNSFKNISDSTSISFGNPALTPEFTNAFEFNYIKNWDDHTLSLSSYYRPSQDVIQRISYMENGIRYSTSENITNSVSAGLELIGKSKLFKILDLTTSLNFFYYKLDGGDFDIRTSANSVKNVHVQGDDDFSWNARVMASVMLPWSISFQATGNYDAARVITQGRRDPSGRLDFGLKKTFFDKKLTFSFNARNVLETRKWHDVTSGVGFSQESESWRGGRRFNFQLSYSFGNMNPGRNKARRRGEGGMEEGGGYDGGGMGGGDE